ncbi:MAG: efflux RND transporter periplasmic adaptor subunit [Arenicellales bacterium]
MVIGKSLTLLIVAAALGGLGWLIFQQLEEQSRDVPPQQRTVRAVPVETEQVINGRMDQVRAFTGTLDANQEFVVSAKVSGRVEEVTVDLADTVRRNQIVARLDNAEYRQAQTQAEADLAVARANFAEAESLLKIADRELARVNTLKERGVSSESEQDTIQANQLARSAHLDVTRAQVTRAVAAVETARIRLGYSDVTASWQGGNDYRVVAERYVDEGSTVGINEPLLRVVEMDQVIAVFYVTERDYRLLKPDQSVSLETDAYPNEVFVGRVARIAPVFRASTRQAKVELLVDNNDLRLKPGMFVRIRVVLESIEDATIVPESALVTRDDKVGVFMLNPDGVTVRWQEVEPGIHQGHLVEVVTNELLKGSVITLGQQLLDDGSSVTVQENKLE